MSESTESPGVATAFDLGPSLDCSSADMARYFFCTPLIWMLLAWAILLGGCATAPTAGSKQPMFLGAEKLPFSYEPLGVHNSCFVESVHFYDRYFQKLGASEEKWAQILEWGNREGDFEIHTGHAVTIFAINHQLWSYDVNFGVQPVDVPLDRRGDLSDISPKIFAKYPQFRPILARYRYDFPQEPLRKPVDFLFYHANPDVRDATRVASELGGARPVRVVEFDLKGARKNQGSAAVVFIFGRRVCLYFPRHGTFESPRYVGAVDDLKYITRVVLRVYPAAENIRWQPGGYFLFPPSEKKSL